MPTEYTAPQMYNSGIRAVITANIGIIDSAVNIDAKSTTTAEIF